MKIFAEVEAVHHEDDLRSLITMATLGDAIERAIAQPTSPFSAMLIKAREEFLAAHQSLLDCDLNTTAGIEQARSLQADARRYQDLCRWITDAWDDREQADETLNGGEEEAAVEELKDLADGNRAKPAPDA